MHTSGTKVEAGGAWTEDAGRERHDTNKTYHKTWRERAMVAPRHTLTH